MKRKTRLLLFFFSLICGLGNASAQVLEDYSMNWEKGSGGTWFSSNDRLLLDINLETFPLSYISFQLPGESVIFVEEKLWFYNEQDSSFSLKLSEFKSQFDQSEVRLTVFKSGIDQQDVYASKDVEEKVFSQSELKTGLVPLERDLSKQAIKDFFILALVLILFLVTIYKLVYPFLFSMMVSPLSLLNAEDFSESGSLQKFFSLDVIFYVFIVNLMGSLALVLGLVFFQRDWFEARISLDFNNLMIVWLVGGLALLILTILKFVGIKIIAYLFDLGRLEFPHFFYLLRLVVIGSFSLILISAFIMMNEFSMLRNAIELSFTGFFWVYIAGIIGLFLIMMNRLGFKKYHLFTYLCIAELVPFLILAKMVMVLGQ